MKKFKHRKSPGEQIRILEAQLKKLQDPMEQEQCRQALHHWRTMAQEFKQRPPGERKHKY